MWASGLDHCIQLILQEGQCRGEGLPALFRPLPPPSLFHWQLQTQLGARSERRQVSGALFVPKSVLWSCDTGTLLCNWSRFELVLCCFSLTVLEWESSFRGWRSSSLACNYNLNSDGLTPDLFLVGHTWQIENLKVKWKTCANDRVFCNF